MLPPYSPDLTLWESNPDKVLIQLRNRTGQSYDVRLSGFAENLDGSVRIVTKDEFARNLGFATYLSLFEDSKRLAAGQGKQWFVTAIRNGQWILWND